MKIFIQLSLLLFLFSCSSPVTRNDAAIRFNGLEHDFGTISLREKAQYSFDFSNPGKTPLIINNVKTSCGCTIPEWPRKPVKPGDKAKIKVVYDSASPGVFYKTI